MNRIDLQGRVAVVTGGARGLGAATARRFIDSGARVAIWDIDAAAIDEAVAVLGDGAEGRVVELTDDEAVREAAEALEREAGSLDILVNNAGITGGNGKTWELDPDVWRKVIEVNLVAPYLTSRAVVPGMVRRGYGLSLIHI